MINITNKTGCCGCTACESICVHSAIKMQPDKLGFLFPKVDLNKCVDCGLCDKVCQFHENYNRYENVDVPKVFALRLKDSLQLSRSQSGGAFYAIAKYIIKHDGVIYGAAFTQEWRVTHQKATNEFEMETLRMSKYVQSDMRGVFPLVKEDLKNGLTVLFSGTACQVAGLKSFIPNRFHKQLVCVDIVCHGVPSPKIWEDYITYLEQTRKSKIVKACFRDKKYGWHGAKETFVYENGNEETRVTSNYLYFTGFSLRKSCSCCHYTNLKRVGDITIGDFWGLPKDSPYEDNKGLSLVLVNSEKGESVFNEIRNEFLVEESTMQECLQPQLQRPSEMNPMQDTFIRDYEEKGFHFIAKRYSDMGWRYKKQLFIESLKNVIRPLIKR